MTDTMLPDYEYQEFTFNRPNEKPLTFQGKLLGNCCVCLEHNNSLDWYVYETKGGKFVCVEEHHIFEEIYSEDNGVSNPIMNNETNYIFAIKESIDDVIRHFGMTSLSNSLYKAMGLDIFERIE